MAKAVLLLSGGLDSTLAGKMLLEMGLEVEAINFVSPFCRCTPKSLGCSAAKKAAEQLGISVRVLACGASYLKAMKHPRFGRGRGMNACLDCRIYIFTRARVYMMEHEGDFIATGEVLGERPMSQLRRAMEIIERESGLAGLIVRPLSARLLPPSLPEQERILERERLKAIQGRSRKPQFELASELGIKDYLCPAGGCLLADREFSARFQDLLEHDPDFGMDDARLLRCGRHFRLPNSTKIIVGRDEGENRVLEAYASRIGHVLLFPRTVPGPSVICHTSSDADDVEMAARLLATYVKGGSDIDVEVRFNQNGRDTEVIRDIHPLSRSIANEWRIGSERPQAILR